MAAQCRNRPARDGRGDLPGRSDLRGAATLGVAGRRRIGALGRGLVAAGRHGGPRRTRPGRSAGPLRPLASTGRRGGALVDELAAAGRRRHRRIPRHAPAGDHRGDALRRSGRSGAPVRQLGADLHSHLYPPLPGTPRRRLPGSGGQILLPQHTGLGHLPLRTELPLRDLGCHAMVGHPPGAGRSAGAGGPAGAAGESGPRAPIGRPELPHHRCPLPFLCPGCLPGHQPRQCRAAVGPAQGGRPAGARAAGCCWPCPAPTPPPGGSPWCWRSSP